MGIPRSLSGPRRMLTDHFRAMARNNAWSNARLLGACEGLSEAEYRAPRTGFFPSLHLTLNHILTVDWFYLDALEGGGRGYACFDPEDPCQSVAELRREQDTADRRLLAYCDRLTEDGLDAPVLLHRPRGTSRETAGRVLPHLFVHQIHHRGQAHAMLSGTSATPPQLDEFFLDEDAPVRADALRRLGL